VPTPNYVALRRVDSASCRIAQSPPENFDLNFMLSCIAENMLYKVSSGTKSGTTVIPEVIMAFTQTKKVKRVIY
jgi:hypothetical protein